jgi:VCBS repeat-containing protein
MSAHVGRTLAPSANRVWAVLAGLALLAGLPTSGQGDEVCATSPFDPAPLGGSTPNTYYPGVPGWSLQPGETTIPIGSPTSGTPIGPGDLLLVIQMQDSDINTDNDGNYGDGAPIGQAPPDHEPGQGSLAYNNVGRYEYVVATGAVVPGTSGNPDTVSIRGKGPDLDGLGPQPSGLLHAYRNEGYVGGVDGHGQRRYQVIRVPRYENLQVPAGGLLARRWDGSTGGILAIDVEGILDLNGQTLDASKRGFRGGGAERVQGETVLPVGSSDYRNVSTVDVHGGKGEGIAGTPKWLYNPALPPPFLEDGFVEGYPGGSRGRGAPGNAGGGGNSENVTSGADNAGGGGGGNGGPGGRGGFSAASAFPIGGFGGAAFRDSVGNRLWGAGRVIPGGGGGAGGRHNNNQDQAHGGAGGGIILVRTGSVAATGGTINANGADAPVTGNDGGGGGGAGGSVILVTLAGDWSSATVTARGGKGANAGSGTSTQGPGGGGGGGVILANAAVGNAQTNGGAGGRTNDGAIAYGAESGPGGTETPGQGDNPFIQPADIPGASSSAECESNGAPVAQDDAYFVTSGATLVVAARGVLVNDFDPEGLTLTSATLLSSPAEGTLSFPGDGSFTFDSTGVTAPSVTFTYRTTDGAALSNVATATITIGNSPPVAADDAYVTDEDTPLTVGAAGVLANDTDENNDPITVNGPAAVSGPSNGLLAIQSDGSFVYTPDANFSGTDSFTYRATDGTDVSNLATVTITVSPVNDAPAAADDAFSTSEDVAIASSTSVLANDSDADGETLSAVLESGPSNGALTFNSDGSFIYTPNANFNGTDSFTYRATDGTVTSGVATVTLTVTSVNDVPQAVDDGYATAEDTPLVVSPGVLDNDVDADLDSLTATLAAGPSNGTLAFNSDGTFTYTPGANFNGTDSFTYTVSDGLATSAPATVTLTVTAINDLPLAVDNAYVTSEDAGLSKSPGVLANDVDPDGDPLSAVLVSGTTSGSLALNSDGTFTYTPNANFNGTDSFTYRATDGADTSNVATVTITVNAVNDLPVAADDGYAGPEDEVLSGSVGVLANDTDADGTPLTALLVTGTSNGILSFNADGTFTYTPFLNFNGADSFTYLAYDGTATSNLATVFLLIGAVGDPDKRQAGYCSSSIAVRGEPAPLVALGGAVLLGALLAARRRAVKGLAALLFLAGFAAAGAEAQDEAPLPRKIAFQEQEKPVEPVAPTAPQEASGSRLLDFDRLEGSARVGILAFSDDFESDAQAAGGVFLRAPSPWVSRDLLGMAQDDVGFYVELTVSHIDRDLDFLDDPDGLLVFAGLGADLTLARDETWLLAGQAGLQYGWFGGVDDTDNGIALTLGVLGGVKVAESFWITLNPQVAFADAGDRLYFAYVGAHLTF